ncbi:hypothetical protein NDU88_006973, partial [Pleurodeles waltl]
HCSKRTFLTVLESILENGTRALQKNSPNNIIQSGERSPKINQSCYSNRLGFNFLCNSKFNKTVVGVHVLQTANTCFVQGTFS